MNPNATTNMQIACNTQPCAALTQSKDSYEIDRLASLPLASECSKSCGGGVRYLGMKTDLNTRYEN